VLDGIARAAWNASNLSEAAVRRAMVLPLLQAAGFDIWNPLEVQPEETNAAGNRPDLTVRCQNGPERGFVLEIKRRELSMVKPALVYLDVVRVVRDHFELPLVAYNVSSECAVVKAASSAGHTDERKIVLETLTSIRRAGADGILTYHALEAARWLEEG